MRQEFLRSILEESQNETINELPQIEGFEISFIDNWGCEDFISLNGIEFFNSDGKKIDIQEKDTKLKV